MIVKKITPKNGNSRRTRKTIGGNIKTLLTCFASLVAIFSLLGSYAVNAMTVNKPGDTSVAYAPLDISFERWGDYTSARYNWQLEPYLSTAVNDYTLRYNTTADGTSFQQVVAYRDSTTSDDIYSVVYKIGGFNDTLGYFEDNQLRITYRGYISVNDTIFNEGLKLYVNNVSSTSCSYASTGSVRVVRRTGDTAEGLVPYSLSNSGINYATVIPALAGGINPAQIEGGVVYIEGQCTIVCNSTYRGYSMQITVPYTLDDTSATYQATYLSAVTERAQALGESIGFENGFDDGYNEGKNDAYNELSDAGVGEATTRKGLWSTIRFVFESIERITSVELFPGFTIGTIVIIHIALALVFIFLKLYAGG